MPQLLRSIESLATLKHYFLWHILWNHTSIKPVGNTVPGTGAPWEERILKCPTEAAPGRRPSSSGDIVQKDIPLPTLAVLSNQIFVRERWCFHKHCLMRQTSIQHTETLTVSMTPRCRQRFHVPAPYSTVDMKCPSCRGIWCGSPSSFNHFDDAGLVRCRSAKEGIVILPSIAPATRVIFLLYLLAVRSEMPNLSFIKVYLFIPISPAASIVIAGHLPPSRLRHCGESNSPRLPPWS